MKFFYIVIFGVKQLKPGDQEAIVNACSLLPDYLHFLICRNPTRPFLTKDKAEQFFEKHLPKECGFHFPIIGPAYFSFMAIEKHVLLSSISEEIFQNYIKNNDIYHLQKLSEFVKIEKSTGFSVFHY